MGPNSPQNSISDQKRKKVNISTEFCIFKLVYVQNCSLNWQFWFLRPNLRKRSILGRKKKKWASLLTSNLTHISSDLTSITPLNSNYRISLSTKLHFKKQFWILGLNLPQKDIFDLKQKNHTFSMRSWSFMVETFLQGGWQAQRHFNVSPPSSRK